MATNPNSKKVLNFRGNSEAKKSPQTKTKTPKVWFFIHLGISFGLILPFFLSFLRNLVFLVCWGTKKTDSAFSTPFLLRSNIRLSNKLMFFPAGFLHSLLFIFITDERERERVCIDRMWIEQVLLFRHPSHFPGTATFEFDSRSFRIKKEEGVFSFFFRSKNVVKNRETFIPTSSSRDENSTIF